MKKWLKSNWPALVGLSFFLLPWVVYSQGSGQFGGVGPPPNLTGQTLSLNSAGLGSVTQFGFPTVQVISIPGLPSTDIAPLCMIDSNLSGQLICGVMKSNGQTEWIYGNTGCVGDLEVGSSGTTMALGPVTNAVNCDNQLTTLNGNIRLTPGTSGNFVSVEAPLVTGPIKAQGTGASVTGTGACATFSATVMHGGEVDAICSGTTGAATVILTPPAGTPAATQSLHCGGSDTGPAGTPGTHLLVGVQDSQGSASCTVSFTSVTTGDYLMLDWSIH